ELPRQVVAPGGVARLVRVDLPDDGVEGEVEHVVLALDVLVERHRARVQPGRQRPHGESPDPFGVEQGDGRLDDALPRQPGLARAFLTEPDGVHLPPFRTMYGKSYI